MADHTILLKNAIKEIARKHGFVATFMAKPFTGEEGSSFHLHQSLWDKRGSTNLFASTYNDVVSHAASHFIAGQLSHLPAATAFFAPCVNSYKRLLPEAFTPVNCTWGYDNRTTALRVLDTADSGCRVENRVPGADANPYLVIAASLASGLLGLRETAVPPEATVGNAYTRSEAPPLPTSLGDSLDALSADDALSRMMGGEIVRLLTVVKRAEYAEYRRHVDDWERRMYLEVL